MWKKGDIKEKIGAFCSRSLRGSVDWNKLVDAADVDYDVAPYAGAWIEILWEEYFGEIKYVAPYAGAWIEILHSRLIIKT